MQQDSTPEARALEQRLGEIVTQLNELDPKTPAADIAALLASDDEPLGLARSEQLASLIYRDVGGEQAGVWPLQNGYVLFRDPQSGRMSAATMEAFAQMISPQGVLGRDPEATRRFPPQLLDAFLDYLDSGRATDPDFAADMNDLREEVQAIISEAAPGTSVELARRLYGEQATVTESGALGPDMQPVSGLYFDSLRLIAVSMDATRGDPAATAYYEAYRILEPLFSNSERQALASAMPVIEQALAGLDREEAQKEYDELRAALARTASDHPSHARIKGQVEDQAALLAQAVKAEAAAGLPATVNQAARTREVFGRFAAAARRGEAEAIMARAARLAAAGTPAASAVLPSAGSGRFGTHPRAGATAPATAPTAGRWQAAAARIREVGASVLGWTGLFRKIDAAHERRDLKTFQQVVADSMRGAIAQRAEVFDTGSELSLREASRIARTANLPRLAQQYDQLSLRLRSRPISAKKLVEDLRQRITDDRIREAVLACGFHRVADSADLGLLADTREKARKVLALATSPTPQRAAGRGRVGERSQEAAARVGSRPLGGEPPVAAASPAAAQSGARPAGPGRRASELTIGFWTQAEFVAGAQQRRIPVGVVEKLGVGNVIQRHPDGAPVADKVIYGPRDMPLASVSLADPALSAGLPATLTDVQKRDAILQRAVQELHKRVLVAELQAGRRISEANLQTYPDLAPLVPAWLYNDRADVVAPRSRGAEVGIGQAVARIGERQLGQSPLQFALGLESDGTTTPSAANKASLQQTLEAARRLQPPVGREVQLQGVEGGLVALSGQRSAVMLPTQAGNWQTYVSGDGEFRPVAAFGHPVDATAAALVLASGGATEASIEAAAAATSSVALPSTITGSGAATWLANGAYVMVPRPEALGGGFTVYTTPDGKRFEPLGPAADQAAAEGLARSHLADTSVEGKLVPHAVDKWLGRFNAAIVASTVPAAGLVGMTWVDHFAQGGAIHNAHEYARRALIEPLVNTPDASPAAIYESAISWVSANLSQPSYLSSDPAAGLNDGEFVRVGHLALSYLRELQAAGVDPKVAADRHLASFLGVDPSLENTFAGAWHKATEAVFDTLRSAGDTLVQLKDAIAERSASYLQASKPAGTIEPPWQPLSDVAEISRAAIARAFTDLSQFGQQAVAPDVYRHAKSLVDEIALDRAGTGDQVAKLAAQAQSTLDDLTMLNLDPGVVLEYYRAVSIPPASRSATLIDTGIHLAQQLGDAAAELASNVQVPAWLSTENLSTARDLADQAVARAQAELSQFGAPSAREVYEVAEQQLSQLVLSGDLWRNQDFGDADRVLVQSWDLALGHLRYLKESGIDPDRAAAYLRSGDAGTAVQAVADAAGTVVETGQRVWDAALARIESAAHAGSSLVGDVHVSAESALGRLAASGREATAPWLGVFEQQGADLLRQGGEQLAVWQHELGIAGEAARSCIANAVPAALERPLGQRLFDYVTDAGAIDRVSTAVGRAVEACKAGAEKGGALARLGQHAESLMQAAGDLAMRTGVHLQAFRQAVEHATGVDAAILAEHAKDVARAAGHAMGVQFALGQDEASHTETHHAGRELPAMRFDLGRVAPAPGPAASLEELARETLAFASTAGKGLSPEAIAAAVPEVAARHGLALAVGAGVSGETQPKRAAAAKSVRDAAATLARDAALAEALAEVGAMQKPALSRAVPARKTISYHEIVERRPRAIRLVLEAGSTPVWFPADAIKIDAAASTVSGRAALIDRKLAEAARRDAGNRLVSLPEAAWSGERSVGYDVLFESEAAEPVQVRIFLPRSVLAEESAAPAWIVGRAVAEAMARLDIVLDPPESWTTLDLRRSDTGKPPVAMTAAEIAAVAAPSAPPRQLKLADELLEAVGAEPVSATAEIGLAVAGILADQDGATAGLHRAIVAGDAEMVSAWLLAGADPNHVLDPAVGPALHAAVGGDLSVAADIADILVAAGADPGMRREADGATALDVVREREALAGRAGRDGARILSEVERIAASRPSPRLYFPEYNAQLVAAALKRSNEGFEIALARGADPNAIVSGRDTVMHLVAADLGAAARLLPDLVREGGNLDAAGNDGRTVRRVLADTAAAAAAAAPVDAVAALKRVLDAGLPDGAALDGTRREEESLVAHVASPAPDVRRVRELLAGGQDIDERRREDGMTALHVAAERGALDVAEVLVDAGADAGLRDLRGLTPAQVMSAAAADVDLEARLLQDRLQQAELPAAARQTVDVAAEIRSPLMEIDGSELDWAAAVDAFAEAGSGPLEFRTAAIALQAGLPASSVAVSDDHVSLHFRVPQAAVALTAERLADHPDVAAVRIDGEAFARGADPVELLDRAIARGDAATVRSIIGGIGPEAAAELVNTPVPHASGRAAVHNSAGHPEILRLVLEAGGDPRLQASPPGDGETPLHCAAAARSPEAAQLLIAAGADPAAPDDSGYTAIGSARANARAVASYHAKETLHERNRANGYPELPDRSDALKRLAAQLEIAERLVRVMDEAPELARAATGLGATGPAGGREAAEVARPQDAAPAVADGPVAAGAAGEPFGMAEPVAPAPPAPGDRGPEAGSKSPLGKLLGIWERASAGFRFKLEADGEVEVIASGPVADRVQAALSARLGPPRDAGQPLDGGEGTRFSWGGIDREMLPGLAQEIADMPAQTPAMRPSAPVVNLHELRSAQARNEAAQSERPERTYIHVPPGRELDAYVLGADRDNAAGMFYLAPSATPERRQAVLSEFEPYERAKSRFTYIDVPPGAEERRRATAMGASWDAIAGQYRIGDSVSQERQAALLRVFPPASAAQRDAAFQQRRQFRLDEQHAFGASSPGAARLVEPLSPEARPAAGSIDTSLVRDGDRRAAGELEDDAASVQARSRGGEKSPHGIAEAMLEAVSETGGQLGGTARSALDRFREARRRAQ
ncbi:MAG: ankyrin repeat domain-containing protein, partial [Ferrovibrionaceae bacterium]